MRGLKEEGKENSQRYAVVCSTHTSRRNMLSFEFFSSMFSFYHSFAFISATYLYKITGKNQWHSHYLTLLVSSYQIVLKLCKTGVSKAKKVEQEWRNICKFLLAPAPPTGTEDCCSHAAMASHKRHIQNHSHATNKRSNTSCKASG